MSQCLLIKIKQNKTTGFTLNAGQALLGERLDDEVAVISDPPMEECRRTVNPSKEIVLSTFTEKTLTLLDEFVPLMKSTLQQFLLEGKPVLKLETKKVDNDQEEHFLGATI